MIEPKQGQENTTLQPNAGKMKEILGKAKRKTGASKGGGTGNLF